MKKRNRLSLISAALALAMVLTLLSGCGKPVTAPETAEPAGQSATEPAAQPEAGAETAGEPEPEAAAGSGRQDGERFEAVIILEGMEETVQYEQVRNEALGFEMAYDYESFVRRSEADRECFISVWDDPAKPENYLEVTYSAEDAESAAAAVREALSQEYELLERTRELEHAGSCLYIEASVLKGTNNMADQLQAVYIIPASDGCRIATAHFAAEAAEGFGRRFAYLLNTLYVMTARS